MIIIDAKEAYRKYREYQDCIAQEQDAIRKAGKEHRDVQAAMRHFMEKIRCAIPNKEQTYVDLRNACCANSSPSHWDVILSEAKKWLEELGYLVREKDGQNGRLYLHIAWKPQDVSEGEQHKCSNPAPAGANQE